MKRGRLSASDRLFIINSAHQNAEPALVAKTLDRSVESVQKIMHEVQAAGNPPETPETPELLESHELEFENQRLRAENENLKQMSGSRKTKGIVVMTAGQSQKVDDYQKVKPAEYFNDQFMARHPNRKTS